MRFDFDKKTFENTILKTAKDNGQLMRLTKILGTKYSIRVACCLFSLIIFCLFNFFINMFIALLTRNGDALAFSNFFKVNFRAIAAVGFIRILYLFMAVFLVVGNLRLKYLMHMNLTEQNIGQKGSTKWTTIEEIQEQFKCIPDHGITFPGHGGIPVCRYEDKLYIDDSATNTIHIGITRSGKGEMFVIPEIDIYSRAEFQPSIVALDLKGELVKTSYSSLKKRGYDVHILNLDQPEKGIQFNPLSLIVQRYKEGDIGDAELLCNSFAYSIYASPESASGDTNAEFFLSTATSAVSALILAHTADCLEEDLRQNAKYKLQWHQKQAAFENLSPREQLQAIHQFNEMKKDMGYKTEDYLDLPYIPPTEAFIPSTTNEKRVNMFSIINTFSSLARIYVNEYTTKLDLYFQSRASLDRAKGIYAAIEVSGDRTKGSIFAQALTKLDIYAYQNIAKLTADSSFNLTDLGFGDRPIALFIVVPFYDRSKDGIASTMIDQIFAANSRRAAHTKELKCNRRIIYHLDEIGNYPPIKSFDTMLSIGLGINQIFNLFLQTYNQLDVKYGKVAQSIRDNCATHIFIQTSNIDTAEYFSKLIGSDTITNISRTGKSLSLDKTITEMYDEKPLLNPNQLMELLPGENVIKRIMKRHDLEGEPIKPTPIFNNFKQGTNFKYRYEYLAKDFPDPDTISFDDLGIEVHNFDSQDLEDCVYDYNISFYKYDYLYLQKKIQKGAPIDDDELETYLKYQKMFQYDARISTLPSYKDIVKLLHTHSAQKISPKLTISEFLDKIDTYGLPESVLKSVYDLVIDGLKRSTPPDPEEEDQAIPGSGVSVPSDPTESAEQFDYYAGLYEDINNLLD